MRLATFLLLSLLVCGMQRAGAQAPQDSTAVAENAPTIEYSDPKPYIINDITVHGIKYLDPDILTASAGLARGETVYIPGNGISRAVSRLWSQRYFSDVKVIAEFLPEDKVNLEIYLRERPRVYQWGFEGIRRGESTTLLNELKLKRGTELSEYVIDRNINLIKSYYSKKGLRNVEVTPRIKNDSLIQNAVNVIFEVKKNNRVRIGAIDFEGNRQFTDRRLRRTMKKTHRTNINILQSFKLDDKEYENDKENIIDFYNSQGYRNAVIVKDSVYTINAKRIGIDITLEEGDKFYIRNVTWVGNTKYSTEFLNRILAVEKGDLYDKRAIHSRLGVGREENFEDMSQVKSMYQNEGYLFSTIDPSEVIIGKDSIDLEIKVFEGKPFTINNVNITGNENVNDEVVRRELYTRPGELYNRALVMQTLRQLMQMQHFDATAIAPGIQPVSNELVDITWPLTEQGSDKVEISGGWGAGMLVGSVGIQLNNLSTREFFKKGAWRPYPKGQSQQLSLRAQTNGTYYTSFMGSFTEPWLGGRKPNSLTLSGHYSSETNNYRFGGNLAGYASDDIPRHFRTVAFAAGLGRRLSWPDPYFTLYTELGYQSYSLKDWRGFLFSNGRSNIITLRTVFARNTIDNPIYPASGSEFSVSLALTPPYSLFDNKDYAKMDQDDPARYKWIEYHKWLLKAQWFYPLTQDQKLVLMTRAEMGYLGHYNSNKISPFEGFDVGGDGMSGYSVYGMDVIGLRGYDDGSITPTYMKSNDYARVYTRYTMEMRYPLLRQGQTMVYGLVFAEAGNAFMKWEQFDPLLLKRSLGAGVRLYLPIIGMIGVDWAYGFDRAVGATKPFGGKVHFVLGMQF